LPEFLGKDGKDGKDERENPRHRHDSSTLPNSPDLSKDGKESKSEENHLTDLTDHEKRGKEEDPSDSKGSSANLTDLTDLTDENSAGMERRFDANPDPNPKSGIEEAFLKQAFEAFGLTPTPLGHFIRPAQAAGYDLTFGNQSPLTNLRRILAELTGKPLDNLKLYETGEGDLLHCRLSQRKGAFTAMNPHKLLDELEQIGITLSITDGGLEVDAPEGVLSVECQQQIAANKSALIQLLTVPGVAPTVVEAFSEQKQRLVRQQQSMLQCEAILDTEVGVEWRKLSELELKALAEDLHRRNIDNDRIQCIVSCLFEMTGQMERVTELGWAVPWWYQEK
jgi:hypothetical protein